MGVWLSVGGRSSSWEMLNGVIRAAGLPEHKEPQQPRYGAPWTLEIGQMGCVVHLQRVAA